jgi:hypothetical protein
MDEKETYTEYFLRNVYYGEEEDMGITIILAVYV